MLLADHASRIPPARLAGVLVQSRQRQGVGVAELAGLSEGRFTPLHLDRIERGMADVDDSEMFELFDLYAVDAERFVTRKDHLVLDLEGQTLSVGDFKVDFDASAGPVHAAVMSRYVELLRRLRGEPDNRAMPLRTDDLTVLSVTLDRDVERLRSELVELMTPAPSGRSVAWPKIAGALGAVIVAGAATGLAAVMGGAPTQTAEADAKTQVDSDQTGRAARSAPTSPRLAPNLTLASVQGSAIAATPDSALASEPASALASEPASASALASESADRRQSVLAEIPWDFESALPEWQVGFENSSRRWYGLTNSVDRTVTVFDDPSLSAHELADVLVHELGHVVDLTAMTDDLRLQWLEMRGMPTVWWAAEGEADFAVGAGDFAEAVASVVLGTPSQSGFGEFTAEQLDFVAGLIPGWQA